MLEEEQCSPVVGGGPCPGDKMFQIPVFVIIIIFCVGFIFLFPEFADQVPLEAFLAGAFLIGQIIYFQVVFPRESGRE